MVQFGREGVVRVLLDEHAYAAPMRELLFGTAAQRHGHTRDVIRHRSLMHSVLSEQCRAGS